MPWRSLRPDFALFAVSAVKGKYRNRKVHEGNKQPAKGAKNSRPTW